MRALKQETVASEQSWIFAVATIFASERLAWASTGERVVYAHPKPGPLGQTVLARSMRARKSRKVVLSAVLPAKTS